jgi:hypothetical protein
MHREKEPSTLLNVVCFLLPFPLTFFLPAGISLLIAFLHHAFFYDPYDHTLVTIIPIAYVLFIAFELIVAIRFSKSASSPRSRAAAQHLLISIEIISALLAFFVASLMLVR